jgi:hypothetical protein
MILIKGMAAATTSAAWAFFDGGYRRDQKKTVASQS